jgi:putative transposase
MTELLNLLFGFLSSFVRRDTELLLENLALRHQLQVVLRSNPRPRLRNRDRMLWVWIRRFCPGTWKWHLVVVRPETVIAWHRRGWRLYWTWRSRARFGRPRLSPEVRALIGRMAFENPTWGTQRIRGELLKLGLAVSARSIRRYRTGPSHRPPSQTLANVPGQSGQGHLGRRPPGGAHDRLPYAVCPLLVSLKGGRSPSNSAQRPHRTVNC